MTPKYLLDTNQASKLLQGAPSVVDKIVDLTWGPIAVPMAVCGELVYMAHHSRYVEENMKGVNRLFELAVLLPVDLRTAILYGEIKQAFMAAFGPKQGEKRAKIKMEHLGLSNNDLWIAATAVQHNLVLVTSDRHFERVQQVRHFDIEMWWSPGVGGSVADLDGGK